MKNYFILLLILIIASVNAQESDLTDFRIGFTHGTGLYFQHDLKVLNNEVENTLPFDVKTVNNFPPWPFTGGYAMIQIRKGFALGPAYQFHTTGSRLGQKDYSGRYYFDQILSSHALGLQGEFLLSEGSGPVFRFLIKGGVNFSTWKLKENLVIGYNEEEDITIFKAVCPFLEPSFSFTWRLSNRLSAIICPAFHIGLGGKYHLKGNSSATTDKKPGWNGPRISFNLEYRNQL